MARGAKEETKQKDVFLTGEGRLINHALFTKDKFDEKSAAKYRIEMVFPKADLANPESELSKLAQKVYDFAAENYGEAIYLDFDPPEQGKTMIATGFKDGDKYAAKREKAGKPGDAYKGMLILRADSIYDKEGQDGSAGIATFGEGGTEDPIGPANSSRIYGGCFGNAAVTNYAYESNDGEPCVKFYLEGFQKTKDGDKLAKGKNFEGVFKPLAGRPAASGDAPAGGGRRRRAG